MFPLILTVQNRDSTRLQSLLRTAGIRGNIPTGNPELKSSYEETLGFHMGEGRKPKTPKP